MVALFITGTAVQFHSQRNRYSICTIIHILPMFVDILHTCIYIFKLAFSYFNIIHSRLMSKRHLKIYDHLCTLLLYYRTSPNGLINIMISGKQMALTFEKEKNKLSVGQERHLTLNLLNFFNGMI